MKPQFHRYWPLAFVACLALGLVIVATNSDKAKPTKSGQPGETEGTFGCLVETAFEQYLPNLLQFRPAICSGPRPDCCHSVSTTC